MFENLNSNTLFGEFIILHLSLYKYISVNLSLLYIFMFMYILHIVHIYIDTSIY